MFILPVNIRPRWPVADEPPKPIKNLDTDRFRIGVPPLMEGYGRENGE